MEKKNKNATSRYLDDTLGEEIASAITHGIGALLAVAMLVILVVLAAKRGDPWRIVSFSIYGASMIILFLMSMFSHAFPNGGVKRFFQIMDYASIYFLIAGTYTPLTLVAIKGAWGWTLFGIIWGLAILGIIFKTFFLGKFEKVSLAIYVAMGWLVVIAIKPLLVNVKPMFLLWLSIGGVLYTVGIIFYVVKQIPFHHAIWHLFVLGGAICIFFGFLFYVA